MILQCCLLVYVALHSALDSIGSFIALMVVEVVPGGALLYALRQPRLLPGWRDAIWCCYVTYTSAETSGSLVQQDSVGSTQLSSLQA